MDIHVARQPIFDIQMNVLGYELLFRKSQRNFYEGTDPDYSTKCVIDNSFLHLGIEVVTNNKKAFINFTENAVINGIPLMLPKEIAVIELLEDIIPSKAVVQACTKLKKEGYVLVLDDFILRNEYLPLVELADIIKIDFRATNPEERKKIIGELRRYSAKFLAEKVESQEEYMEGIEQGYSYFQGYFFEKPTIISSKKLPETTIQCFTFLQEFSRSEFDFSAIEEIIKRDISLPYMLLKFINSASFGIRNKITSLKQALALLGKNELLKWISLIMIRGVGTNKPDEIILDSLILAKFCEVLSNAKFSKQEADKAFLMGLFSYIDVLLDRTMSQVLEEIPLEDTIKKALLGQEESGLLVLRRLVNCYKRGRWDECWNYAGLLSLDEKVICSAYCEAISWAQDIVRIETAGS